MGHENCIGDAVMVEPHQRHAVNQSDIETMLHTILDHIREPIMSYRPGNMHFLSGPWHNKFTKGHHQKVFVPNVDMRETKHDYYFDIELPGVSDKSSINIEWTSNRKLLVEGIITRPTLTETFGLSRDWDSKERGDGVNGLSEGDSQTEELATETNIPISTREDMAEKDLFPINLVHGVQLDIGDRHFSEIKRMPRDEVLSSHIHNPDSMNPDRAATVTIAERNVGRYMRLFMFPANVYMGGLRAKLELGLLRINIPKTKDALDESWKMTVE